MTEVLNEAERKEVAALVSPLIGAARTCQVTTHALYADAGERLKLIKGAQKTLEAKKKKVLDPALAAVKAIRELFKAPEDELAEAEGLYKRSMIAFDDEQEQIRRKEQARLDEIARREREKAEEQAKANREKAEAARQAGNDKAAERLEAKAEIAQDKAFTVVAATAQTEAPRVSGTAIREVWSAVVTDMPALIAAVARGEVPAMALSANMKFLDNQARAMKRELKYPGVTATVEKSLASRSS